MINLQDDSFNVSSYIRSPETLPIDRNDEMEIKIKAAYDWMDKVGKIIIIPTDNIEDLELQWNKFCDMTVKFRHESDWESISIFGIKNQDHYEEIKRNILNSNEKPPIEEDHPMIEDAVMVDGLSDYGYDYDRVNYTEEEVNKAIQWGQENNRIIIIPTRTLDELEILWDAFNAMTLKHRRESDWKSQELFGMTNLRHYEFYKLSFLRRDLQKDDFEKYGHLIESASIQSPYHRQITKYLLNECGKSSNLDITKSLLEVMTHKPTIQEEVLSDTIVSDILDKSEAIETYPTLDAPYGDMPMIEPDDMMDMGVYSSNPEDNYYGVSADNLNVSESVSTHDWFISYKGYRLGLHTEFSYLSSDWINKLRELSYGLSKMTDENKIKARKQSILELGWNPEVPFNSYTLKVAKELASFKTYKETDYTRVVDLSEFNIDEYNNVTLNETTKVLRPIFIVLTQGQAIHSKAIMWYTKSNYSHASISLDSSLTEMYSFSMDESVKGWKDGFVLEDVRKKSAGTKIGVFAFFVSETVYNQMKDKIEEYKVNVMDTLYSYGNLVSIVFNIPWDRTGDTEANKRMICSQFVDKCLKFMGIDVTHKDSSIVSPGDFGKIAKKNRRIYTIYEGLASKYKPSRTDALISKLMTRERSVKALKEELENVYYENERSYVRGIISNIHNPEILIEMENHFDIVKTERLRRILDQNIFSVLRIEPYAEFATEKKGANKSLSIQDVNKLLESTMESY